MMFLRRALIACALAGWSWSAWGGADQVLELGNQ